MGTTRYIHCRECVKIHPKDRPMEKFARLSCSIEPGGFLVSCVRHRRPVVLVTPEQLKTWMESTPECELCKRGVPHEHTH